MEDSSDRRLRIVDAHVHLYDAAANVHPFLAATDPIYEFLVPGYRALPGRYLVEDHHEGAGSFDIQGVVAHEYLSTDAVKEVQWIQQLAERTPLPVAIVGLVDFRDPRLPERLDLYQSLPKVTAVREHLGWDATNPLRRLAQRADLLNDPAWRAGLKCLRGRNLKCGLEVFGPQLSDLLAVVQRHPEVQFTIAVMGWPTDLQTGGFQQWRQDIGKLARCGNVCASISAIECVFGMDWEVETISP